MLTYTIYHTWILWVWAWECFRSRTWLSSTDGTWPATRPWDMLRPASSALMKHVFSRFLWVSNIPYQWMIGLREKMQDPPSHISWENLWFTVDFPLSQSIEPRRSGRFKAPSSFWNPLKMFFRSQIGRYLAPFAYAVVSSSYGFKVAVFLSLEPRAIKIEVSSSSKVEIWWIDIQPPSILTH